MSDETKQIARILDQMAHEVLDQLKDLSGEELTRPLTLPEGPPTRSLPLLLTW